MNYSWIINPFKKMLFSLTKKEEDLWKLKKMKDLHFCKKLDQKKYGEKRKKDQ